MKLSDDGRFLICRESEMPILYDTTGGEPVKIARSRPKGRDYTNARLTATLTPDGNSVAVCENISEFNGRGGHKTQISLRPRANPTLEAAKWSVETTNVIHDDPVVANGEVITAESPFNEKKLRWEVVLVARDLSTGKELRSSAPVGEGAKSPLASTDGQFVVCMHGKKLVVWSAGVWSKPPVSVVSDNKKFFTGIAFHPGGKHLAATSNDKTVKLYNTTKWTAGKRFTWKIGKMRSIAFSPDGTLAAAGSDLGQIVVWDVDL